MTKSSAIAPTPDDPHRDARWNIVYCDTFDRECPPSVEVEGRGLVPGLIELWARFLFETVQTVSSNRNGTVAQLPSRGFSEFALSVDGVACGVSLRGSLVGAHRLKNWVFAAAADDAAGILDRADLRVLRAVAEAHAASGSLDDAALVVLDAAESARDIDDLLHRVAKLR